MIGEPRQLVKFTCSVSCDDLDFGLAIFFLVCNILCNTLNIRVYNVPIRCIYYPTWVCSHFIIITLDVLCDIRIGYAYVFTKWSRWIIILSDHFNPESSNHISELYTDML